MSSNNNVKPLVIANWKMHGDAQFNGNLITAITAQLSDLDQAEVAICPPFPYLSQLRSLLSDTARIKLGAQTVSKYHDGAYTGEVSASMLDDLGCDFTLIGHSERRSLFAESDSAVARKCERLLEASIIPVLCVGETLEERQAEQTMAVVERQIMAVLSHCEHDKLADLVIAYEPVWAIGTGETASPEQVQQVHHSIRNLLSQQLGEDTAGSIRILYGGSVKPNNAAELFAQQDVNGGLIGGASLLADDFVAICRAAS